MMIGREGAIADTGPVFRGWTEGRSSGGASTSFELAQPWAACRASEAEVRAGTEGSRQPRREGAVAVRDFQDEEQDHEGKEQ